MEGLIQQNHKAESYIDAYQRFLLSDFKFCKFELSVIKQIREINYLPKLLNNNSFLYTICLINERDSILERFDIAKFKSFDQIHFLDRDFCLKALCKHQSVLEVLPEVYRKDKEVVKEAVKQSSQAFKYAHDELKEDRSYICELVNVNGAVLEFCSSQFCEDEEIVANAVENNGQSLKFVSTHFKNDKNIVRKAIKINGGYFKYASDELKSEREFVLEIVGQKGTALLQAQEELKDDIQIVKTALNHDAQALEQAGAQFQVDSDLVFEIVQRNPKVVHLVSRQLQANLAFVERLLQIKCNVQRYLPDEFKRKAEVIEESLKISGVSLEQAPEEVRKDAKQAQIALNENIRAITYVHDDLKADMNFIMPWVEKHGYILKQLKNQKDNKELIKAACKTFPAAIECIQPYLRNDYELALDAVKINGECLCYLSNEFKNDYQLVNEAVKNSQFSIKYAESKILNDKDVMISILKEYKWLFPFKPILQKDREMILSLVKVNGLAYEYIDYSFQSDHQIIQESLSQNGQALMLMTDIIRNDSYQASVAIESKYMSICYVGKSLLRNPEFMMNVLRTKKMLLPWVDEKLRVDEEFTLILIEMNNQGLTFMVLMEQYRFNVPNRLRIYTYMRIIAYFFAISVVIMCILKVFLEINKKLDQLGFYAQEQNVENMIDVTNTNYENNYQVDTGQFCLNLQFKYL